MGDIFQEHVEQLRRDAPSLDISAEWLRGMGIFTLGDAVVHVTRQRSSAEFDATCEVTPFVASRFDQLDDRTFVYDGKRYTLVGSWQEDSGQPVTLMFRTEPV